MRTMPFWIYVVLLLQPFVGRGQDQHFSQFYASALTLNPALSGAFDGGYRLSTVYRDQGRGILGSPYATFSGAVDLRFAAQGTGKSSKDAFGAGVIFYSDRSADINFYTNQIALAGAFHKSLSRKGDHFLSAGFQVGISQRNINYENITFNDQFHIRDGYVYGTQEVLPENNFAIVDMATGIHYAYAPKRQPGIYAGFSSYHLLEPNFSFYREGASGEAVEKLHRKYSAHAGLLLPLNNFLQFSPRALVYMQGPHLAANAGANLRMLVNDTKGYALHVGGWLRPVKNSDQNFALDAAVALFGIEYSNFLIGMSYDLGLSSLNTSGRRNAAFEISIAFLGNYSNETILCPKF